MSEGWVSSAKAEGTGSAGAVWEGPRAGSAHRSGAGEFVPAGGAGWFPEESSQREGCAEEEGGAPWLQQREEEHLRGSWGRGQALHRVPTQGDVAVEVAEEDLCRPRSPVMTVTR